MGERNRKPPSLSRPVGLHSAVGAPAESPAPGPSPGPGSPRRCFGGGGCAQVAGDHAHPGTGVRLSVDPSRACAQRHTTPFGPAGVTEVFRPDLGSRMEHGISEDRVGRAVS